MRIPLDSPALRQATPLSLFRLSAQQLHCDTLTQAPRVGEGGSFCSVLGLIMVAAQVTAGKVLGLSEEAPNSQGKESMLECAKLHTQNFL